MKKQYYILGLILMANLSYAGPLIYTPTNPSFGGNPAYGSILLGEAQVQDQNKAPVEPKNVDSALDTFNKRLQTALINRLTSNVISSVVNGSGKIGEGTVETTDFKVDIVDIGKGVLRITTTSKLTGQVQTFEYDQEADSSL